MANALFDDEVHRLELFHLEHLVMNVIQTLLSSEVISAVQKCLELKKSMKLHHGNPSDMTQLDFQSMEAVMLF